MKKDLLDLLKMLSEKDNDVSCMFNGDGFLDAEITALTEIIMEQYKIPIENEIIFEQLMNFSTGDITKKKLVDKYLSNTSSAV
jgi:hypothetical protein